MQLPADFQTVETRCGREGLTRPRGPSEKPRWSGPQDLVEHLREQERHNVTVITVGSKYEVYVRSPASSHMQTVKQPFRTLAIKWEVNIFLKKSFLRLYHASFIHASVFDVVSLWCWILPFIYWLRFSSWPDRPKRVISESMVEHSISRVEYFSLIEKLVRTLELFWSSDWNHPIRAMVQSDPVLNSHPSNWLNLMCLFTQDKSWLNYMTKKQNTKKKQLNNLFCNTATKKRDKKQVWVLTIFIIFTNPSARTGYVTRSIFKRSLTGLNSEYSFSETSCLTKAEEPSLSYYVPIAGGRIIGFIPFSRV